MAPKEKTAPAPGFLSAGSVGQGGDAGRADRGHGESQAFNVAGQAVHDVAQAELIEALHEHAQDHQADGGVPGRLKKGAEAQDVGIVGSDPGGDLVGDAHGPHVLALDEELVPQEAAAGDEGGPGHVIDDVDFGAFELGKRAAGDFDEENERDPLGGRADGLADHQVHVHAGRAS